MARQREKDGKDVQQARVIEERDGNVLTDARSVTGRWKKYFEELMNEMIHCGNPWREKLKGKEKEEPSQ